MGSQQPGQVETPERPVTGTPLAQSRLRVSTPSFAQLAEPVGTRMQKVSLPLGDRVL